MAEPELCTTSRANDYATALDFRRSLTTSSECSTSFEVEVERRLTVWCWRVILVFGMEKPRKGKIEN
jgi:hypothetical protein